jgi:hypothetical protein
MLIFLLALQAAPQSITQSVVADARRAIAPLTDTIAARTNGFVPLFEVRITDRTPFQGEHWIHQPRLAADTTLSIGLNEPAFVMFGLVNGRTERVGTAYITRLRQGATGPVGLGGDNGAEWHTHQFCRNVPGLGALILADGAEDCVAQGGTTTPRQLFMVHVWTDVPNPEGMYAHDNPALPYLAVGLKPPGPHDLHDPGRVHTTRALALAIAETYDARMPVARGVERGNTDAALADSMRAHRAAIAARIPALKSADASGDRNAYDKTAQRMIGEWEALVRLYEHMAPTPETLARLKRETEMALTHSHH